MGLGWGFLNKIFIKYNINYGRLLVLYEKYWIFLRFELNFYFVILCKEVVNYELGWYYMFEE